MYDNEFEEEEPLSEAMAAVSGGRGCNNISGVGEGSRVVYQCEQDEFYHPSFSYTSRRT